jgi:hypothetical protein
VTASLRGLAILAAIAVALAVIALRGGAREVEDRALAPGVDVAAIDRLTWARPGEPDVVAVRDRGAWTWAGAPASPDAIDGVLTALRAGRWQRRGDAAVAGAVAATLTIGPSGLALAVAQPLAGTDQTWLVAGDRALLVDAWIARALAPPPRALRVARPIAGATVGTIELAGDRGTRAIDLATGRLGDGVATLRLAPAPLDELGRAVDELEIVALPAAAPGDAAAGSGVRVTVRAPGHADRWAQLGAACAGHPELVAIRAGTGDGCVVAAAAARVADVYARLAVPLSRAPGDLAAIAAIADHRIVAAPTTVQLPDGTRIAVDTSRASAADRATAANPAIANDTDPAAVRALVDAVTAPCEVVAIPDAQVRGELAVTERDGDEVHAELRGDVVVRAGEPVGLRPAAPALAVIESPGGLFASRTLWVDEPLSITTLSIDNETLWRGAVVGEWSSPPARFAAITRLAEVVASPRAVASLAVPPASVFDAHPHVINYGSRSPVGPERTRKLVVFTAPDGQCATRSDGHARYVERELCDAVAEVIASRR